MSQGRLKENPDEYLLFNNYSIDSQKQNKTDLEQNHLNTYLRREICRNESPKINVLEALRCALNSSDPSNVLKVFKSKLTKENCKLMFTELPSNNKQKLLSYLYRSKMYTMFDILSTNTDIPFLYILLNYDLKYKNNTWYGYEMSEENVQYIIIDSVHQQNHDFTDEQHNNICSLVNDLIAEFKPQKMYTEDEMATHSLIAFVWNTLLEYFVVKNNTEYIDKIFTFLHTVGSVKGCNFSRIINEREEESETRERPFDIQSDYPNLVDERYIYQYLRFYRSFNNGKFFATVIHKKCNLTKFILYCKQNCFNIDILRPEYTQVYSKFYNSLRPKNTINYSTFIYMQKLIFSNPKPEIVISLLEQNYTVLNFCMTDRNWLSGKYGGYIHNFVRNLKVKDLSDDLKSRYWKMIATYLNSTSMGMTKVKTILEAIMDANTNYESNMSITDVIDGLRGLLNPDKEIALVAAYLD